MEIILESALLLVVAAPVIRLLLKKPVLCELRARPALTVAALLAAVVVAALLVWVCVRSDFSRRAFVAGALAAALLAYVRAQPGYGRSSGIPPGSLGLASSLDAITDEDFYARCAKRWGPVFKMSQFHRPVICVVDLPRGLELMHAQRDALAHAWLRSADHRGRTRRTRESPLAFLASEQRLEDCNLTACGARGRDSLSPGPSPSVSSRKPVRNAGEDAA